jgi:hypothetical protein
MVAAPVPTVVQPMERKGELFTHINGVELVVGLEMDDPRPLNF